MKKRSRQRRAWFDTRFGGAEALLTMTQAEMASKDDRRFETRFGGAEALLTMTQA